jgi:hypothetical protein
MKLKPGLEAALRMLVEGSTIYVGSSEWEALVQYEKICRSFDMEVLPGYTIIRQDYDRTVHARLKPGAMKIIFESRHETPSKQIVALGNFQITRDGSLVESDCG